jgi:hypothetical protein
MIDPRIDVFFDLLDGLLDGLLHGLLDGQTMHSSMAWAREFTSPIRL